MLDNYIFSQMNNLAGQYLWLDTLAIFCANYLPYVLIAFLLLFLLNPVRNFVSSKQPLGKNFAISNGVKDFKKNKKLVLTAFLAAGFSRIIVELIRLFYLRLRPFVENQVNLLLFHPATASFPSGHSAFFFALSTVVYFYNKKAGILFLIASFLIVVSRVFAGIHWPSDILVGAILGILFAYLINRLFFTAQPGKSRF